MVLGLWNSQIQLQKQTHFKNMVCHRLFKSYFVQQDLHTLGTIQTLLKLTKMRQSLSFFERHVKQRKVRAEHDSP